MTVHARAGISVPAEDETALATDVYLPSHGKRFPSRRFPAVLLRTYLGKFQHTAEAVGWARRGFACAVQDVRGRYDSEGLWRPYTSERRDGRATVDWLLAQPWCDGRVTALGGSYAAFTAWSAALGHPAVRAVISSVPAMRPMPLQPEDGGVLPLLSRVCWWTTHNGARCARTGLADALLKHASKALEHLPVVDLPERLWTDLPGWREAVLTTEGPACMLSEDTVHQDDGAAAEALIEDAELAFLDVAALHVGGWHDPFCAETLRQFEGVGRALDPRPPRSLVLGPWWHQLGSDRPARYGERHYGEESRFPLGRFQVDWLRRVLQGEPPDPTPVRTFLCGENRWLLAAAWSDPPLTESVFYAACERLSPQPPVREGEASFLYDPRNPHPCRRTPLDESALEERRDVVVFTTAPLEGPLRVVGTPRLTLWASTDAPSVDWVARLLEVTADGRRLYLAHGLVDAVRALAARGERLEPGLPQRFELRLAPLGVTVPPGSRLRLELTGSAFPSYARNLASGESRLTGSQPRQARQTVHWGPCCATALELPVHVEIHGNAPPESSPRVERTVGTGVAA